MRRTPQREVITSASRSGQGWPSIISTGYLLAWGDRSDADGHCVLDACWIVLLAEEIYEQLKEWKWAHGSSLMWTGYEVTEGKSSSWKPKKPGVLARHSAGSYSD